jgi:glycine betaine/proline transport system substrate-binding protein
VNCQRRLKRDVFLDAWRIRTKITGLYGENLVVIGEAFSDATTGLVVPTYTINSIEELNAKDKFKVKLVVVVLVFIATRLKQ